MNINTIWRGTLVALALNFVCGAAIAQNAADKTFIMKIATATLNDGQHEWMKRFAAAIGRNSAGRIKVELYPASQLGSTPRMIEGTQLGSIQMYIGPPEFFVGVDPRFELLSAAGLFESEQHAVRVARDPEFSKAFLAVGVNRGLIGTSLFIGAPVAYVMRTPLRTLADFIGKKIRVLASPFQTEQVSRIGGTAVPMSLVDVLPALQQGTIDGSLSGINVFSPLGYYASAKYMNETGQAIIFSLAAMSKRWFDTLPADLQSMVLATAQEIGIEVNPWEVDFLARQRKIWVEKGGVINILSATDHAALTARTATIGDDIVKTKPELKPLWDQLRAAVERTR
jgi:TRAP-type transport system periplasmic protein